MNEVRLEIQKALETLGHRDSSWKSVIADTGDTRFTLTGSTSASGIRAKRLL